MPLPFIFTGGADRRYSFASADPFAVVKAVPRGTMVERTGKKKAPFGGDVFSAITALFSETAADAEIGKERFPFTGGVAGYFSYNLRHGAKSRKDELTLPDCVAGLYGAVYVFDGVENKSFVVCADDGRFLDAFQKIKTALTNGGNRQKHDDIALQKAGSGFVSNTTRDEYIRAVKIAQEYIKDGDIYQINISHRLKIQWQGDPFALFAWLVKNRPLPFSAFMDMGDFQIISNSPERLLKTDGTSAETSPIKGTRPRGRTPEEDKRFIWALKNSAKERAEHVMIVDLERSDLGAVSAPGSVNVTEFEAVKTFPGLHHMVSTISSTLESSSLECLRAIFPGGSVTGAPKIRAMEIIDELENAPRGLYTGGLGWVDFSGDMDMTMAIRTAVYKDGALYLSVGSGIVADSKPEEEYDETILKAKDFFDAIIKK
jgi:para-aminobenzoate synthetase component 1